MARFTDATPCRVSEPGGFGELPSRVTDNLFWLGIARNHDSFAGRARLSGGQRQRIAIARAFLKDSPIILLDEPTSALDTETEEAFLKAMAQLVKGSTVVMIAHRLSTVRMADKIVVLDPGSVVEEGPHEELLKTPGSRYRSIYLSQRGNDESLRRHQMEHA